jgi:hypothetical protein
MRRMPLLAFLVALGGNIAVALGAHHFPYEDLPNHLARYVLLDRALSGHPAPYILTRLSPGPYVGLDLIGVALVHTVGAAITARVLAVAVVIAFPVGLYLLLWAVAPASRAWALAAIPLGLGFFPAVGFVNYTIGIGALLAWLALWWSSRPGTRVTIVALTAGLLFTIHLAAVLIALVVIWTDWFRNRRHRLPTVLAVTAVVAALALWSVLTRPPDVATSAHMVFNTPFVKARNVLTPFFVFTYAQLAVTLAAYAVAAVCFARANRPFPGWNTLGAAALACLAIYFVFPSNGPGTGYLDVRWLLPVYLLPFAGVAGGARPPTRTALAAMLAAGVVNAGAFWVTTRPIDRQLDDYAAVLDALPPGGRLLPLVADGERHGPRVFPYRHFAFWYVIDRGGRVPSLFNYNGTGGGAPQERFVGHFVETNQLYTVSPDWGTREFAPLDWTRIAADYDYIVLAGDDPRARNELVPHAREIKRVGDVSSWVVVVLLRGPVAESRRGGAAPDAGQRTVPQLADAFAADAE